MKSTVWLRAPSFWSVLLSMDQELAEQTRRQGCSCGGRLHCANYSRKPRGVPDGLPEEYRLRLSFCCDREGCRKRTTPPSVRFLGRKVYLGVIVVLVAALQQGATRCRVRALSQRFGANRSTISRWQRFWQEHFPQTTFWKVARARLAPVFHMAAYPRSLVDAFVQCDDDRRGWARLLRFLSPISIAKGLAITVSAAGQPPAEDARQPS